MGVSPRSVMRALVFGLLLALAVPAIALGQSQTGTQGNGNGSQSGDVTNNQSNSGQTANGNGNNQNQTNQNCVAGRDCVNNNITNQNSTTAAPRTFERQPVTVRRARVRTVVLAHTGSDLRLLFLVGALMAGGGLAVLMTVRRRSLVT